MKTVLVIGGTHGVGKQIIEHYAPHSLSVSRTNGFNIQKRDDREKIVTLSLDYDIVVNHAYCGDSSQTDMLHELYNGWKEHNKEGYIFNTGTIATYMVNNNKVQNYPATKIGQDVLCKQIAKQTQIRNVKFNVTNMICGMLDTERSRAKPHWPGTGLTGERYIEIMEWLYNMPEENVIPEIIIETKIPTT